MSHQAFVIVERFPVETVYLIFVYTARLIFRLKDDSNVEDTGSVQFVF
jgi:hypothetical protein